MISTTFLPTVALLASFLNIQVVVANWDAATGHVYDVRPSDAWMAKNKPTRITKAIQVAECAINTRLAFPDVQLFALFKTNHECDGYHGCPYGDCWAFTTFPQPDELVVDFTNFHTFFWHGTGGITGTGPRPIANPQTGEDGWESSLDGVFHNGKPDMSSLQTSHDSNYPGFHPEILKKWTPAARATYASLVAPGYPQQPKCGKPDEPNKDPGSNPGTYGGYKPAPASAYKPPKPYTGDSTGSNAPTTPTNPPANSNVTHPTNPPTGPNATYPTNPPATNLPTTPAPNATHSINPPTGPNATHSTNPPSSSNATNLPTTPAPGSNDTNVPTTPAPGSNDTNIPTTPAPGSNDTTHSTKKPKHHGHQGHSNSTKHHGHQGRHETDQGNNTSSFNSTTNDTKCAPFCRCTSVCSQDDECCRDTCKEKYTACNPQECQAGNLSTIFTPSPYPIIPPPSVVQRHRRRTARH